jgi:glycine C-acetyltransferase
MEYVGTQTVSFLRDRGVFVTAITYPVIPLGLLMYRMIPTASHTEEDVDHTLRVFREMRDTMSLQLSMSGKDEKKVGKVYGE